MNTNSVFKAEKQVLSTLLNAPQSYEKIFSFLEPKDFSNNEHATLFKVMKDLYDDGISIEDTILIQRLERLSLTEKLPASTVMDISDDYVTAANLENYLDIVQQESIRRSISVLGNDMSKATSGGELDVRDTIANIERRFLDITRNRKTGDFKSISNVSDEILRQLQHIKEEGLQITGTPVGYKELDKMTAGFQPGDMVVLAARPGVGKTALALNMLLNSSKTLKDDECVVLFSLEMPAQQLGKRLLTSEAMVDSWKLKTANLSADEWIKTEMARETLQTLNIELDDTAGLELLDMKAKLQNLSASKKIKLIVVDYLQLLTARGHASQSRQQEITTISRTMKMIAGELGCPIIALSQLSRGVEAREDKRPMMSDLRESGAIEQDADMILFLYREDYYQKDETPEEQSSSKIMEVIVAKNRHGSTGTIKLLFHKNYGRFDNI